jgi:hypothetical protein
MAFAVCTLHGGLEHRPHGRLAELGAVHHPIWMLHSMTNRAASLGCMRRASMLLQTGGPVFCTLSLARGTPGSIYSRPSAAHSYQTHMAALCDSRRRRARPNGIARVRRSLSNTHFHTPTPPRCTHSVSARLKTTLESLVMRLVRFCLVTWGFSVRTPESQGSR